MFEGRDSSGIALHSYSRSIFQQVVEFRVESVLWQVMAELH